MIVPSVLRRNYQRGGWGPGTRHQKHMSLNPTLYLYRFPGPHGPGPYTMKYWWTLGCFPTGMDAPFRLKEFLSTYQQEHVPPEVEEWLRCYVKNPFNELVAACEGFFEAVEAYPEVEPARGYKPLQPAIAPLHDPLKKFQDQLGVRISPVGLRNVLSKPVLRERFLDDLFEYKSSVEKYGSTPHRRLARKNLEDSLNVEEKICVSSIQRQQTEIGEDISAFIGSTLSPPETTADDERRLIYVLTTISEGCADRGNYVDASSSLADALMFCHDPDAQAVTHANLAVTSLLKGDFRGAEYYGKEAALLQPQVKSASDSCAKGYAVWAAAVAFQDDFEKADAVLKDGLTMCAGSRQLQDLVDKLGTVCDRAFSCGGNKLTSWRMKGCRLSLPSQQWRGLINGSGRGFNNEFDWVEFKGKLYPNKMNPQTNEMGSVFRRVGDMGSFISSSRSTETL